jgi:1-acyl-sn-glycerol-3-phosphate acyltransferase
LLQAGQVLVITPEGRITRAADRVNGIAKLKPGVGYLAARLGTPIMLVGIVNTDTCWELGSRLPKIKLSPRKRPTIRLAVEFVEIEAGSPGRSITADLQNRLSRIVSELEDTL